MIIYVPLDQLRDNPFQKRRSYDGIEELAADIYSHKTTRPDTLGLQQIPNGRLVGNDDGLLVPSANLDNEEWLDGDKLRPGWHVQLEFGHRRARAFTHLMESGRSEYYVMPVIIRDLSDEQMLDGVHSENFAREDISAVEEAELVAEKIALTGRSQKDVAKEWGMGRSTITNLLALLKLPEEVQEANRQGILSARQCDALRTIARIGELADDVEWADSDDDGEYAFYNQPPTSPADYIQRVIDDPGITSDDIREATKKRLNHAGVILPDAVARHDYSGAPANVEANLIQHQCKGCTWRINQHCLNGRCVETKTAHFIDLALAEAAAELGVPVSDDEKHFNLDWSQREALEAYWETEPADDPNLVIGWQDHSSGARPFADDYWTREEAVWGKDGNPRNAVVLGYRDRLAIPTVAAEDAPDLADEATRDGWQKQVSQVRKSNVATAKARLREVMETAVADFAPIVALIQPPDAETTDDASALVEGFVEFLWQKGAVPWSNNVADEAANLNKILQRAGAEPLPALNFHERAVAALSRWYGVRDYQGYYRDEQVAAAAAIEELRRETEGQHLGDPDMLQLSFELDRAAADARRVLGEEEVGEAAAEFEYDTNEHGDVICADCGDLLERDTEEHCSCGAAVCEDCYVERGHVLHDETRDAMYDDLVETLETVGTVANPIKAAVTQFIDSQDDWPELAGRTFTAPLHYLRAFGEEKPFGYFDRIRAEFLESGDGVTDEMIRMAAAEVWSERHPSGVVLETAVSEEV